MAEAILSTPRRQLTLIDCLGIGINGIIGSGIFLLTAKIWRQAGGKAPLAWLLTGVICSLVALCFAEAASRTERSGGPYRYAHEAFGPYIGFAVGWVTFLSFILGYAAVAKGFGEQLARTEWIMRPLLQIFSIEANPQRFATIVGMALVVLLGGVNVLGVHIGAKTSSTISAVKILSLLLFVGVGIFFVKWGRLWMGPMPAIDPDSHQPESTGVLAAAFTALFAMTGVEYLSVPAGEVKRPTRTIPWALGLSVIFVMIIYILVQVVSGGTTSNLQNSTNAIVDAAQSFSGVPGRRFMELAFLISALGYCAGSALVGPRYLEVFAQDGFLPKALHLRSARWGTPILATLVFSGLVLFFVQFAGFAQLADLSNIAVVIQYLSTCIAVLILRKKSKPADGGVVIPGGPLIPILAIVGCTAFLAGVGKTEWVVAGSAMIVGLLLSIVWRWLGHETRSDVTS